MQMNELVAGNAAPEVFRQLGQLTRQLHDALNQLGLMPRLQESAAGLPDARSRLDYIARKTGEAADKVLTAVEAAKREQAAVIEATRRIAAGNGADVSALAALACAAAQRSDERLTEIMLAQDFHDLTGQVVAKVAALAIELEDSLVKLLVQAAPVEPATRAEPPALAGPRLDAGPARGEQLASQREVDDLLASLGF